MSSQYKAVYLEWQLKLLKERIKKDEESRVKQQQESKMNDLFTVKLYKFGVIYYTEHHQTKENIVEKLLELSESSIKTNGRYLRIRKEHANESPVQ